MAFSTYMERNGKSIISCSLGITEAFRFTGRLSSCVSWSRRKTLIKRVPSLGERTCMQLGEGLLNVSDALPGA